MYKTVMGSIRKHQIIWVSHVDYEIGNEKVVMENLRNMKN